MAQQLKIGSLVESGWTGYTRAELEDQAKHRYIMLWESPKLGTMATQSLPYFERGVVLDMTHDMVLVQFSKCKGWAYDEAVRLLEE